MLETDWTCFVNPWIRKLEFVAGRHHVLKGLSNPDVFALPPGGSATSSMLDSLDPIAAENVKKLQAGISNILVQFVLQTAGAISHRNSSRCRNNKLLNSSNTSSSTAEALEEPIPTCWKRPLAAANVLRR
jgi:hypothetical protein